MIEEPKTTPNKHSPRSGEVTTHPAFAAISASRVSGSVMLNGSDFEHRSFISIKVCPAEMHRDGSRDSIMADNSPLIEVNVSEAQWATFVSSMNIGSGVACTLKSFNGVALPDLPPPTDRRDKFKSEAIAKLDLALDTLRELKDGIQATNLSKTAQRDLQSKIDKVAQQINDNLPYVAQQFDKHMETTTEKAKIEISAFALNTTVRLGLQKLREEGAGADPAQAIGWGGTPSEPSKPA